MKTQLNYELLQYITPQVRLVIDRTGFKGWSVPKRTISDHELVLIVGGNGSFTIEGIEHKVRPGMLFYFYPDLIHSGKTGFNPPIHFFAAHFSFITARNANSKWAVDTNPAILPLSPVTELNNDHKALQTFKKLHKIWTQKRYKYEWETNIVFQQLLYDIINDLNNPPQNHANLKRVENIMEYINIHYNKAISIDELSSIIDISPGYLTSIFKDVTGKTPIEYINHVRIDCSKDLLINTSLKIKDIAYQVGFKDEFYFTRVFKNLEGCSPSAFARGFYK